jgi:hypothetical protein
MGILPRGCPLTSPPYQGATSSMHKAKPWRGFKRRQIRKIRKKIRRI